MRPLLLIAYALLLVGCSINVDRYSWSGPPGFEQSRQACIQEANAAYVPWVAGSGPRLTLYKDCMERRGYTRTGG